MMGKGEMIADSLPFVATEPLVEEVSRRNPRVEHHADWHENQHHSGI